MEILFVAPELAPYSRFSSTADVCAALPKALRGLEHRVLVVSPLYTGVDASAHSLARRLSTVDVEYGGTPYACEIYDGRTTGGVDLIFIGQKELFGEAALDERASLVFSLAAVELASKLDPAPQLLHAHDWQTAASVVLAKEKLPQLPSVLSVHHPREAGALQDKSALPPALSAAVNGSLAGLLAAGVARADRVAVNGATMAAQLSSPDSGLGLDAVLAERPDAVSGINNGLDAASWNPITDIHLDSRFDPADLTGKSVCKGAVQYELKLPSRPEVPMVAVLLAAGAEGSVEPIEQLVEGLDGADVQLVVQLNDAAQAPSLQALAEKQPERLALWVGDAQAIAHRLLGAADFLLQASASDADLHLGAQRYGTLPIALSAGAVADTAVDCDVELTTGTAFLFDSDQELLPATQRALAAYARHQAFDHLRRRVMRQDSSWERSARRYEHMYRGLIG